jgi:acyl carrier protein
MPVPLKTRHERLWRPVPMYTEIAASQEPITTIISRTLKNYRDKFILPESEEISMKNNITFDDFKHMVSEDLGVNEDNLNRDTSFITDLGIDSLSLVNFVLKIEKKYGVRFNNENGFMLRTLGEAFDIFTESLKTKDKDSV